IDLTLFVTNAENQVEFAKLTPIMPSGEEALDDPYFTDDPEDADATVLVRLTSAEQLPDAELLTPPLDNANDLQTVVRYAFGRALLGEDSPAASLDQAEEEWNDIVNE